MGGSFGAYTAPPTGIPEPFVLTTMAPQCVGYLAGPTGATQSTSSVWGPGTNVAVFYPFTITSPHVYTGMIWINGTVVSGNVNGAIYSADGTTALGTIGSVAQAGTTATQQKAFPAPVALAPGTYFMALAMDNVTGTIVGQATLVRQLRTSGCRTAAAFFALTASAAATWVGYTAANKAHCFGIYEAGWL